MQRKLPLLVPILLAIAAVLLLIPVPRTGRTLPTLMDIGHVPLGGLLALFLHGQLRGRFSTHVRVADVVAFVGATGALAAVEFVQPLVGRSAGLGDLARGSLGAAGAILLRAAWEGRGVVRIVAGAAGVAVLIVPCIKPAIRLFDIVRQHVEMPMLASFENDLELSRWSFEEAEGKRVPSHATAGEASLRLQLAKTRWPGATLVWPPQDWSGYRTLALDIHLEGGAALTLEIKVTDRMHRNQYDDRFNRTFELRPGPNPLRIPLADIASGPARRQLDLTRVATLQLFAHDVAAPRVLYLDNVRLE